MTSTRLIRLTFEVANDTEVERGESFTLEATSANSYVRITRNMVEVEVSDYVATADLSVIGPTDIAEGETVTIGIELDRPLIQFLADNLAVDTSYEENVFAGSNFEDISSATGVREFSIVSNSEAYTRRWALASGSMEKHTTLSRSTQTVSLALLMTLTICSTARTIPRDIGVVIHPPLMAK